MKKISKLFVVSLVLVSTVLFITACGKKEIDYLVLVNKQTKLPDDWEEKVELVEVKNGQNETYKVEKKAAEAYEKLRKELADEGIIIELDSTTRSVAEQQKLWDEWTVEYGEDYVKKYVAVPGYSEHHTGLAIDIMLMKDGKEISDNDEMIAEREIFSKIHPKLAKYGFILRYLEGKDEITGYGYEPWHFRYIDNPEIAKEIMDKGLTFEEYLANKEYGDYIGYQFSGKDPWGNELAITIRTLLNGKLTWTFTDVIGDGKDSLTLYNELTTEFKNNESTFSINGKADDSHTFNYIGSLMLKDGKLFVKYEKGELTSKSSEGDSTSHNVAALEESARTITLTKVVDNN